MKRKPAINLDESDDDDYINESPCPPPSKYQKLTNSNVRGCKKSPSVYSSFSSLPNPFVVPSKKDVASVIPKEFLDRYEIFMNEIDIPRGSGYSNKDPPNYSMILEFIKSQNKYVYIYIYIYIHTYIRYIHIAIIFLQRMGCVNIGVLK